MPNQGNNNDPRGANDTPAQRRANNPLTDAEKAAEARAAESLAARRAEQQRLDEANARRDNAAQN